MPSVKKRGKNAQAKKAGKRRATKGKPQRKKKGPKTKATWTTLGDGRRLLALDFSSATTGWAFFENERLRDSGKHRMEGATHSEKLSNFREWVRGLFRDYAPTAVAFEAPFQGRHANAYGVLVMYKAILLLAHWEAFGTPFPDENQIPAHLIKRTLGVPKAKGKTTDERRRANKQAVIKVINSVFGTAFRYAEPGVVRGAAVRSDDDIADAVAVGYTWYLLHERMEAA